MSAGNTPDQHQPPRRRSLFDPIGRIVDSVVPTVADAVDVDDIVSRIDVDALLGRIDVDELMARIDVDELVGRIDVDALLDRIDVDKLMARIDVDKLIARIDVDHVIGRVDLDAAMARVDIDALVERVDVDRIVQRSDLAGIVAQSTRGITASTIDLLRRQIAGIDEIITRIAARFVRRDPNLDPDSPPALEGAVVASGHDHEQPSISGHYAGPVARTAALLLDWSTMLFVFGLATAVTVWTLDLLLDRDGSEPGIGSLFSAILFGLWALAYFAAPLALTGRTFGKAVVGLRVVRADGGPLKWGQAIVRVLVLPLSIAFLGLGLLGGVFGRRRRTLHDVVARTAEVIDWGDRPAALPTPLNDWLARRRQTSHNGQMSNEDPPVGD